MTEVFLTSFFEDDINIVQNVHSTKVNYSHHISKALKYRPTLLGTIQLRRAGGAYSSRLSAVSQTHEQVGDSDLEHTLIDFLLLVKKNSKSTLISTYLIPEIVLVQILSVFSAF